MESGTVQTNQDSEVVTTAALIRFLEKRGVSILLYYSHFPANRTVGTVSKVDISLSLLFFSTYLFDV